MKIEVDFPVITAGLAPRSEGPKPVVAARSALDGFVADMANSMRSFTHRVLAKLLNDFARRRHDGLSIA
jgi:hypothetical protein